MASPSIDAASRLIVALDVPGVDDARRVVDTLDGVASFFKIGLTLQLAPGVEALISALIERGKRVFLDYKYYDIEATLHRAVQRAAATGVSFLTIHGPGKLIRAAVEGRGSSDLKLFTVTVLTSLDKDDIAEMGYSEHTVEQLVLFRARKALDAGCDGVIASGAEAEQIKRISGGKLLVVTPGIRRASDAANEQTRRIGPGAAIAAGADYLVVGRPIIAAADPRSEAASFVEEMQGVSDARS
jgi:orotidine-5'-phosphate decarboxylase